MTNEEENKCSRCGSKRFADVNINKSDKRHFIRICSKCGLAKTSHGRRIQG
jgi:transcription elongation factor Elf1